MFSVVGICAVTGTERQHGRVALIFKVLFDLLPECPVTHEGPQWGLSSCTRHSKGDSDSGAQQSKQGGSEKSVAASTKLGLTFVSKRQHSVNQQWDTTNYIYMQVVVSVVNVKLWIYTSRKFSHYSLKPVAVFSIMILTRAWSDLAHYLNLSSPSGEPEDEDPLILHQAWLSLSGHSPDRLFARTRCWRTLTVVSETDRTLTTACGWVSRHHAHWLREFSAVKPHFLGVFVFVAEVLSQEITAWCVESRSFPLTWNCVSVSVTNDTGFILNLQYGN